MSGIAINAMADAIMEELEKFAGNTIENSHKAVIMVANDAVKELKSANPAGSGQYGSWANYNKSWDSKIVKSNAKQYERVVYNKKYYRLTHLLENGHRTVDGGSTRKFEHIKPVADKVAEKLEKQILEGIKKHD